MKFLASLGLIVMLGVAASAQTPERRETLTNESIINLTKARFKESTIITLIRTSDVKFDITTSKLVELKKRGVNEKVISEMIARANLAAAAAASQGIGSLRDDEFFAKDDEAFFNGPIFKGNGNDKETRRREDETSIFGSQSGSKSGTRSKGNMGGPNSDRQNQSEVMGSASVRIIRPSSEGSGEPKLQRATRLDNKGVLDLIQAGFTEGTVIRKIETSQVDFDLSKKGIDELRKNRVSESIIKSMTTAMEESK